MPVSVARRMLFSYSELNNLLNKESGIFAKMRLTGNIINVMIDVDPIIRVCCSDKYAQEYILLGDKDKDLPIIYAIMKVVAHYKRYLSKQNLQSRVFCYHSINPSPYAEEVMGRPVGNLRVFNFKNTPYYMESIEKDMYKALSKFETICQHTVGVYSLNTHKIFQASMPHMMLNAQENNSNLSVGGTIIISSDIMSYQYASDEYDAYHKNVVTLMPRGRIVLDPKKIVETYIEKFAKTALPFVKPHSDILNPYLREIMAILGNTQYGMLSCNRGKYERLFNFIVDDVAIPMVEDPSATICDFIKTDERKEQFMKNIQLCNAPLMATKCTAEDRALLNSQLADYTNVDVLGELTLLFDRHFESTAFVVGNFLRS
jgi:hypothetical protein